MTLISLISYKKNLFHSAQPHQVQIHHNHHSPDFPTNIRGRSANGVERSKEGRENERLVYYFISTDNLIPV